MFIIKLTPAVVLAFLAGANAKDIFVSPTGTGSGTLAAPYGSIQSAIDAAKAGDFIYLQKGTYAPSKNIQIKTSGAKGSPITVKPYQSEKVIIDGENMPGIINGPYGIYARDASNNYYEGLSTHDNYETGFQLEGASANNQVINLDSYRNRDPRKNGESADGFACKDGTGEGNVLRNARLWDNVDDGLDLYMFGSPVTLDEVYAWGNGFNLWDFKDFNGDGNGFKLGITNNPPANHIVKNCIAFQNAKKGFIDNGNPGSLTFNRNTAWKNGDNGFNLRSSSSKVTKNIAVGNKGEQVSLNSKVTASGNSWDSKDTWNDASFKSTNAATLKGARGSDGRVKASDFLVPASGAGLGATTQAKV
ncbi:Ff.00g131360.m01.CDS01 [Fusarium sp. VM40]|nr:Ff.00g131360.m01.CDS01 [Fusarium sp. VM40]